ncbi:MULTISPECIES: hypothetical protein [unclassified Bradyrhizobium]|uniref:hypothetical protein n=1 Tax=unclassified Bradyrhizobium TaxID=2631580 RepID=UPI0028E73B5A|nr:MULTISPECIES: hypothetical protein [unclassified Bradyrhizobium]
MLFESDDPALDPHQPIGKRLVAAREPRADRIAGDAACHEIASTELPKAIDHE